MSSGGTRKPVTPSTITSPSPPRLNATTGVPHACASAAASPKGSSHLAGYWLTAGEPWRRFDGRLLPHGRQDVPALGDVGKRATAARVSCGEGNVRRAFRSITTAADIGEDWTPRELRHTFVSIMSDNDVPIEKIADLVGHRTAVVTQTVYRHQLRPVVETGATAMNSILNRQGKTPSK